MLTHTEFLCNRTEKTFRLAMPRHFPRLRMTCYCCHRYHWVHAIATWFRGRRVAG
jgi:hypothetical protein